MKSRSIVRPGTGVLLRVNFCSDSSLSVLREIKGLCRALDRLLIGLKKSLMALRFFCGCSMVQDQLDDVLRLPRESSLVLCISDPWPSEVPMDV